MLNNVPTSIMRSARNVTLRHPNAIDCTVWRKQVLRVSTDTPEEVGGMPTIGGMGVLNSEDEADFEYVPLGDGKVVFTGVFQTGGGNFRDDSATLTYNEPPVEALIECVLEPGTVADPEADPPIEHDYFVPQKGDMVTVEPGAGIVLSYEVVDVTGNVAIPPYTRKYVLNPRQDQNVGI